ncbi:MAG: hypothetical protein ACRCR9_02530 [Chitinophagaceae bacterium]
MKPLKNKFLINLTLLLCLFVTCSISFVHAQDDLYGIGIQKLPRSVPTTHSYNHYNTYDYNSSNQPFYDNHYPTSDQVPYLNAPAYDDSKNKIPPYNYATNNPADNQNFQAEFVTTTYYPNYSIFYSPWFYPSIGLGLGWGGFYNNIAFNWGLGWGGFYNGWGPFGFPSYYRPYYGNFYPMYYGRNSGIYNRQGIYPPNNSNSGRATIYNPPSSSQNRGTYYNNSNPAYNGINNYRNQNYNYYNNPNYNNRPTYYPTPSYNGNSGGGGFRSGGGGFRSGGGGFRR